MTKIRPNTAKAEIIYHVSDSHGSNIDWPVNLLRHYHKHHAPLPLTVVHTGDLFELSASQANDENAITQKYNDLMCNVALREIMDRHLFLSQWDDWDYGGDNSSATHTTSRGLYTIDREMILHIRDELFPFPQIRLNNENDARWTHRTSNIMIIAPDSRSFKHPIAVTENDGTCTNLLDGSGEAQCWGEDQLQWIDEKLLSARQNRIERIIFISTQSFVDNLYPPPFPCDGPLMGIRDSLGIFHKYERNEVLKMVKALGLENRFVVWSGDDHTALVRRRETWHKPYPVKDPDQLEIETDLLPSFPIYEFKAGNGGSTTRLFDHENLPPLWWSGLAEDYHTVPPPWGSSNSKHAAIGFCWKFQRKKPAEVTAVLLENERTSYFPGQIPRKAGFEFWTRTL